MTGCPAFMPVNMTSEKRFSCKMKGKLFWVKITRAYELKEIILKYVYLVCTYINWVKVNGIVFTQNENLLTIYSPLVCSKP